ncbi:MAG: hypothetical protein CVT60_02795 [Actinobacteria bacterium HGW-Actinobacteria-10]|jgi:DNA-binding transcriptional ArsR family regulator|nr:MAG: hypothetical protein CVT60_02795 [Actinobacteria bacterium HGW-Actinobacteria-10]
MNSSIDIITALFGGYARTAILRLLAEHDAPLTGRQVAELAHLSQPGAAKALEHLAALGIITRRRVGRAITHELERDNLLVQSLVLPAIDAERLFLADLAGELRAAFGGIAKSVVLFGSVARDDAVFGSDIDVLVVVTDDEAAREADRIADESGTRFFRRYGMPLSVIISPASALSSSSETFLTRVIEEGLLISGVPLNEVIADGSL